MSPTEGSSTASDPWEEHAGWWQEGFTEGADPEYEEQMLPIIAAQLRGAARVLDVGCGEGQVARHLLHVAGATEVVGVDPSVNQLVVAAERGGGPRYVRGVASSLPCASATFDAAVACLVFEHIVEVDQAITEVARVLRPGGVFLFLLNHPLLQVPGSGWIDDHILEEQYWRIGPYLIEDETEEEIAPGIFLPFIHRPLSRYLNALVENGLVLEEMLEPAPPPGFVARAPEYADVVHIPRLLVLQRVAPTDRFTRTEATARRDVVAYRIFMSEPTVGEAEARAAGDRIHARKITAGPAVAEFEQAFATFVGMPEAVAVDSGTAALHLALLDTGVGPGDEVWLSDLTFIATANAASYCGARVTVVDSEPDTWNLDPNVVVDELGSRARAGAPMPAAIVPVHLLGHPAELGPILDAAQEHGIPVIEDAAEALGSRWIDGPLASRVPGTVGTVGIYSFNGNKIMTTGGGGMLVSTDREGLARIRHISHQAKVPGTDYEHDAIGFNYRLSHVAAAIGSVQLTQLDGMIERRREIAARYAAAFADLPDVGAAPDAPWAWRSGWLASIVLADAAMLHGVRQALESAAIEARPVWRPMREQKPYQDAIVLGGSVAPALAARILCLPCSAHLTGEEQDEVIEVVRGAVASA